MAIKNLLLRGDCHGSFDWMSVQLKDYDPEETAVIILGDAGLNFYLNKTDKKLKEEVNARHYYLYIVRGNHEQRPEHLPNIQHMYDENVSGNVMYEPEYPYIRYFEETEPIYIINGYRCLVLNGAYSIDKWYRLARAGLTAETNIPKKTFWFSDEQLTADEQAKVEKAIVDSGNYTFDFVFSHTCPRRYQPTDMFLSFIDQATVDSSTEDWMDNLVNKLSITSAWCFGHYHADRIEAPHVEQYFNDIENLDILTQRWRKYDETETLDWWLVKSPAMKRILGE